MPHRILSALTASLSALAITSPALAHSATASHLHAEAWIAASLALLIVAALLARAFKP